MKKIIVAGAGHGGISAAKSLAENGFDVTVYEKNLRENIGYDWRDCIYIDAFGEAGFAPPPVEALFSFGDMAYRNPSKTVKILKPSGGGKLFYAERKEILKSLISQAEASGVKFVFGKEITAPLCDDERVNGFIADGEEVYADLVIDSAGIDSPLRTQLPVRFGIMNNITGKDAFGVYRAYFDKKEEVYSEPRYTVFFDHCGKPGMDWVITEDGFIDVLVGSFGELTKADVDAAVTDFRIEYPCMGSKILRGGSVEKIPLRRTLPMLVCSGYAALGDAASMTEPLCGSGITCSLRAGKILADTLSGTGGDCSLGGLWKYQYRYFKQVGEMYMQEDLIKNVLRELTADELDFLLDRGIIGKIELAGGKYKFTDIIRKISMASRPAIVVKFSKVLLSLMKKNRVFAMMPEKYDAEEVTAWMKEYERL